MSYDKNKSFISGVKLLLIVSLPAFLTAMVIVNNLPLKTADNGNAHPDIKAVSLSDEEKAFVVGARFDISVSAQTEANRELNPNSRARAAHLMGFKFLKSLADHHFESKQIDGKQIPEQYDPRRALELGIYCLSSTELTNKEAIKKSLEIVDKFHKRTAAFAANGSDASSEPLSDGIVGEVDNSLTTFDDFTTSLKRNFKYDPKTGKFDEATIQADLVAAIVAIESCCDHSRVASYHVFPAWKGYARLPESADKIDTFLENLKLEKEFTLAVKAVATDVKLLSHLVDVEESVTRRIDTLNAFKSDNRQDLEEIIEDAQNDSTWASGEGPDEFDPTKYGSNA